MSFRRTKLLFESLESRHLMAGDIGTPTPGFVTAEPKPSVPPPAAIVATSSVVQAETSVAPEFEAEAVDQVVADLALDAEAPIVPPDPFGAFESSAVREVVTEDTTPAPILFDNRSLATGFDFGAPANETFRFPLIAVSDDEVLEATEEELDDAADPGSADNLRLNGSADKASAEQTTDETAQVSQRLREGETSEQATDQSSSETV